MENPGVRRTATMFGVPAIIGGMAGAFAPLNTSHVITEAFPGFWGKLWFVGLMLTGVAALVGDRMHSYSGTVVAATGLGAGGCWLFSYGVLMLVVAWPTSATASGFIFALAAACLYQAGAIWNRNHKVRTSLRGG